MNEIKNQQEDRGNKDSKYVSRSRYRLIRDITEQECTWLSRSFKKGDIVYKYDGNTYGAISSNGSAFTIEEFRTPFYELPNDAVEVYN